jgi:phage gpG-like protein
MSNQHLQAIFIDDGIGLFIGAVLKRLKDVEGGEKKYIGLLSAIVFRDVIEHFQDETGPEGPWAPWSDMYYEHLQSIGRGANQMLQFSGKLRQNFKPSKVRRTGSDLLWFNDAKTASGFPYAAAHDEGGGRLPKRTFMWLSDFAMEDISQQTLAFMIEEGA